VVARRLTGPRGLSEQEARERIVAQAPQADKVRRAAVVIDNSGPLADTERQVEEAWRRLVYSERDRPPPGP